VRFANLKKFKPSDRVLSVTKAFWNRCDGQEGTISSKECEFLLGILENCDAKTIVEIGVASGASAFMMLAMMDSMGDKRRLFSYDLLDFFYGDSSKPVGYITLESEFNDPDQFILSPKTIAGNARTVLIQVNGVSLDTVDLVFVDGSHRHPWATLDVLALLPLLKIGGWVVLHDINLPHLTNLNEDHGPGILFNYDFGERFVIESTHPNIGAIKISDKGQAYDALLSSLSEKWEISLDSEQQNLLKSEVAPFLNETQSVLFSQLIEHSTG